MIDAATIGITLALQDGVSEGIAAIQRDLSALDRAVDASAVNLGRLGAVASALQSGPLAGLTGAVARAANSVLPRTAAPGAAAPPAVEPAAPSKRGNVAPPLSPLTTLAAPRPDTATTPARVAPVAATRPTALPPSLATFAPVFQMPPPVSPPLPPLLPTPSAPAAPRAADGAPAAGFSINLTGHDSTSPPPPAMAPLPGPRASVAPVGPPGESPARARSPATLPAPPDRPPADATGTRPEQSQTGRIVLEGYELGRWMTDRLTRDATRPPASATGFDPRLSPAWPGAGSGL